MEVPLELAQGRAMGGFQVQRKMPCWVWWIEPIKMSVRAPGHFVRRNHEVLKVWLMKVRKGKHES